jgi:hypothetical protein
VLEVVEEQRDFGVLISSDLKPAKPIATCTKNANQRSELVKRCFSNLTSENISILYRSPIRPVLEYGSPVWNPTLVKDASALEKRRIVSSASGWVGVSKTLRRLNLENGVRTWVKR